MSKKLEGKIAVITGGTEGIGLATAQLFVREGAYVFNVGCRQKEPPSTVPDVRQYRIRLLPWVMTAKRTLG